MNKQEDWTLGVVQKVMNAKVFYKPNRTTVCKLRETISTLNKQIEVLQKLRDLNERKLEDLCKNLRR